eukprot:Platyproteum_vivax@DN1497_c0_g1_i1.p1
MYAIQEISPLIPKTGIIKTKIDLASNNCEAVLEQTADILEMPHKYKVTQVTDFVKERLESGEGQYSATTAGLKSIQCINKTIKIKWFESLLKNVYETLPEELIKMLPGLDACSTKKLAKIQTQNLRTTPQRFCVNINRHA